jgi:hypothetical protein
VLCVELHQQDMNAELLHPRGGATHAIGIPVPVRWAEDGVLRLLRLGPMAAPAREARRRAVQLLPLHQIGPVLAQQSRQLADQLLVATGTIGEGASGHQR